MTPTICTWKTCGFNRMVSHFTRISCVTVTHGTDILPQMKCSGRVCISRRWLATASCGESEKVRFVLHWFENQWLDWYNSRLILDATTGQMISSSSPSRCLDRTNNQTFTRFVTGGTETLNNLWWCNTYLSSGTGSVLREAQVGPSTQRNVVYLRKITLWKVFLGWKFWTIQCFFEVVKGSSWRNVVRKSNAYSSQLIS